jgi:hypothetical protein
VHLANQRRLLAVRRGHALPVTAANPVTEPIGVDRSVSLSRNLGAQLLDLELKALLFRGGLRAQYLILVLRLLPAAHIDDENSARDERENCHAQRDTQSSITPIAWRPTHQSILRDASHPGNASTARPTAGRRIQKET